MMTRSNSTMNQPYFQVPNDLFKLELSPTEKLVLIYLYRCGNQDRDIFPSYNVIAEHCSITKQTAIKAIQSIEDKGLVKVIRRRKSNKDNLPNRYILPGELILPVTDKSVLPGSNISLPNKELPINNLPYKETPTGNFHEKNSAGSISFNKFVAKIGIDDTAEYAIDYFLIEYRRRFGKEHMRLKEDTWLKVSKSILWVYPSYKDPRELTLEEIQTMINRYFQKDYQKECNYCITHFNDSQIKNVLFYETVYYYSDDSD